MNTPVRTLALAFFCTVGAGAAHAASFDCARIANDAQELVCRNAALSAADEEMAAAYQEALEQAEIPVKVRNGQLRWIVGVRDRCDTVQCLRDAYEARIVRLETLGWRHGLIFTRADPPVIAPAMVPVSATR